MFSIRKTFFKKETRKCSDLIIFYKRLTGQRLLVTALCDKFKQRSGIILSEDLKISNKIRVIPPD